MPVTSKIQGKRFLTRRQVSTVSASIFIMGLIATAPKTFVTPLQANDASVPASQIQVVIDDFNPADFAISEFAD